MTRHIVLPQGAGEEIRAAAKRFGTAQVVLFGSRARGDAEPRSDIDLAVQGGDVTGFRAWLEDESRVAVAFDIVCLDEPTSPQLKADIARDGVLLYDRRADFRHCEAFSRQVSVLETVDPSLTTDAVYRMGVVGQFQLTFDMAWKAAKEVLRYDGMNVSGSGSPRMILRTAYENGLIDDVQTWFSMLERRNAAIHVYNEHSADELVLMIQHKYARVFSALLTRLEQRRAQIERDMLLGPKTEAD